MAAGSSRLLQTKFDFWIKHNKNVLFEGKHGVGKTAMVTEAFDRHKLKWLYFSASTMDPWIDFIGVPREQIEDKIPADIDIIKEMAAIDANIAIEWVQSNWKLTDVSARRVVEHAMKREQGVTSLDLVRPKSFANGDVEALFFDEFNRSPKKVRNAVMELIQFKSINGMKFPNLRIVWAAINPADEENTYDVEKLDPAQADRFHITVAVPYRPNVDWFRQTYTPRIADAAIQWWDENSVENQAEVSPRRLQYALDIYMQNGDMRDVLPISVNTSKLLNALNTGPITEKLEQFVQTGDFEGARKFMENENQYISAMKFIQKDEELQKFFYPLLPKEKLSVLMSDDDKSANFIINNSDKVLVFNEICNEIMKAGTNKRLANKIRRMFTENQDLAMRVSENSKNPPAKSFFNLKNVNYADILSKLEKNPPTTTTVRAEIYADIEKNIPEILSEEQAIATLSILNNLFVADENTDGNWSFDSAVNHSFFANLMGIVNHCLREIKRQGSYEKTFDIISAHGPKFQKLLSKIYVGGLTDRMVR